MTDQSKTSNPKTLKDSTSATSSQALEDGHTHSNSQDGMHLDLFGQAVAPVKVSQSQDNVKVQVTSVTSGLRGSGSSESQSLQQSLGSKLLERLDSVGLTQSQQILKRVTTDSLRPYCQDTLSEPIIGGSDYGSWPTAISTDGTKASPRFREKNQNGMMAVASLLPMDTWPTPRSRDGTAGASKLNENGKRQSDTTGIQFGATLKDSVHTWPTPSARDYKGGYHGGRTRNGHISTDSLDITAQLIGEQSSGTEKWKEAPWPTPRSSKAMTDTVESSLKRMQKMGYEGKLEQAVALTGEQSSGLDVKTGKPARSRLNPKFSLWLMGYPKSWINKAIPENTVMQGH